MGGLYNYREGYPIDYRRTGIGNRSHAQYKCTGISEGHPYRTNSYV